MIRYLLLACLAVAGGAAHLSADDGWLTDPAAAAAQASASGKPILMDFTGSDWCIWCQRLHEEVFATPAFKAWAAKKAVLLVVDFPNAKPQSEAEKARNQKLAEKYAIEGFPTIVLTDARGVELGRLGYQPGGPEAWIAAAERALGR